MIISIIFVVFILFCIMLLIKNFVTLINHKIISDAIYEYRCNAIEMGTYKIAKSLVFYDDIENYYTTLFRLWDWGYTRILPPEKFEIIKPFIGGEKRWY